MPSSPAANKLTIVLPDGASYAEGGHFVTCIPCLGRLSTQVLPLVGINFFPDQREDHAKQ
ncbi:hypothetical protein HDF12_003319 [Edaphobacter lichenicola]|uniref:Uncharacterized protein n=1 Tax=Tunturiibacter lichenicola TaxID=2051959 RepID=A0A7Y9TBA1_9BACT|nr:hypothetical protein [Edaphobacter lichenicola]